MRFSHSRNGAYKIIANKSLGVPSPLCILELSRPIHIDMAVKNNNYICVIYKVLVYVQTSQTWLRRLYIH